MLHVFVLSLCLFDDNIRGLRSIFVAVYFPKLRLKQMYALFGQTFQISKQWHFQHSNIEWAFTKS